MFLTDIQIQTLKDAIEQYDYPCVTFDFAKGEEVVHPDMRSVEDLIGGQLTSGNEDTVKDGLSNVLYWGFASQTGRQGYRLGQFRDRVTQPTLGRLKDDLVDPKSLDAGAMIKTFCNEVTSFKFAFATKALMFLDPERFVVLDSRIGELNGARTRTVLSELKTRGRYEALCDLCQRIVREHSDELGLGTRAVDIERGIYTLVKNGRLEDAAEIIAASSA